MSRYMDQTIDIIRQVCGTFGKSTGGLVEECEDSIDAEREAGHTDVAEALCGKREHLLRAQGHLESAAAELVIARATV